MDSSTAAVVAARLGVPASRVLRWCREGAIDAHKDDRGRWLVGPDVVECMVGRVGAVPEPHPAGFRRHDLLVLAALVVAPRGLPSVRAVAVRTGLAPTTASGVLTDLHDRGLVERRSENRLMRGHVRPMGIWYADLLDPTVERLLPYLHTVVLPDPDGSRRGRLPSRLPTHLWHQVWNADPQSIDPREHAVYLAHRALTTGDPEALAWAVTHLPAAAFDEALTRRGIPGRAAGWARAAHQLEAADATAT